MRRLVLLFLAIAVATPAYGQWRRSRDGDFKAANTEYDGRFTFVRLRFDPGPAFGPGNPCWEGRDLKWCHDYPRAERHLMKILDEATELSPYLEGSNILATDDPELFKYPVAYLAEPGFWTLTESETEGLRNYLLKGGFLIIDDFIDSQWYNFQARMKEVLPEGRLIQLDASHPVFNSFFGITSIDYTHPYFPLSSIFYGIFEGNDPTKRLMVIVNYNNDIGEYWEWSDTGFLPIELSNEAYKIGVNYIIYAMTH